MRTKILGLLAVALLAGPLVANADMTYTDTRTITHDVLGQRTVDLSITTDGTWGELSSDNIVGWSITVSGLQPASASGSTPFYNNVGLFATHFDLSFDFSGAGLFLLSDYTSAFYCLGGSARESYCYQKPGEEAAVNWPEDAGSAQSRSGQLTIARSCHATLPETSCVSGEDGTVPEPGTLALAAVALLGMVGMRRRRSS